MIYIKDGWAIVAAVCLLLLFVVLFVNVVINANNIEKLADRLENNE